MLISQTIDNVMTTNRYPANLYTTCLPTLVGPLHALAFHLQSRVAQNGYGFYFYAFLRERERNNLLGLENSWVDVCPAIMGGLLTNFFYGVL